MNQSDSHEYHVYVGTYTNRSSAGIHLYSFNVQSGSLTYHDGVAGVESPSFLAIDDRRGNLYAVSETNDSDGEVVSFAIDPTNGKLSMNGRQSTLGAAPCHVSMDQEGKSLVIANYLGGNVNLFEILPDGKLADMADNVHHHGSSIRLDRQEGPHPHSAILDPTNQYVFVPDLGSDKIIVYKLDLNDFKLIVHGEVSMSPGAGPRHCVFHPSGSFFYVINELDSTIAAFHYEATRGSLHAVQTVSTLPAEFAGVNYCADIHVSPSGKYLYGSNRGHDSIVVFEINESNGTLTLVEHTSTQGRTPRNFALSPDGNFLLAANQDSDSIVIFKIDSVSGKMAATGNVVHISKPVCIQLVALRS